MWVYTRASVLLFYDAKNRFLLYFFLYIMSALAFSMTSAKLPFWYSSIMMSHPPINSPATYSCGMVGQLLQNKVCVYLRRVSFRCERFRRGHGEDAHKRKTE